MSEYRAMSDDERHESARYWLERCRAVLAGAEPPAVAVPSAASDGTPSMLGVDPDNAT